ncbi:MAG TPA: 3-methyl-2-oxobutanoate hydroxymethyltransferase [Kiritimatiellia bacterium]|nr:3-methyl-2-oxobutanoate hydroxymethyltransferase [Kiritimatiellia bacterium]
MTNIKWTAPRIRALKGKQKIAMLTAGDFTFSRLLDEAGIPCILVGDSLGMTMLGYDSTLPVTLDQIIHHTAAVVRGAKNALVITDLPFMTYQASLEQALLSAGRCLKEAGADAVKLEGGVVRAPTIEALTSNGIPVLGHIGILPQSVKSAGGYRVQGKTERDAQRLLEDAHAVAEAGAFAVVLEGMPPDVAAQITAAIEIPTIGIGAGAQCDGQVLVIHDVLGLTSGHVPKFAKQYARLGEAINKAVSEYRAEVESGQFPSDEYTYRPSDRS